MMRGGLHMGDGLLDAAVSSAVTAAVGALFVTLFWFGLADASEGGDERVEAAEAEQESDEIVIRVVFDNNPGVEGSETAWGFSCVIEGLEETILFDSGGRGKLLLANMAALGIGAEDIDVVVLSHAHRDHTGGLGALLERREAVEEAGGAARVVMPESFPSGVKREVRELGAELVETGGPRQVCRGAWTTGVLGDGEQEQGLYVVTSKGLIVITGCAHPGIVALAAAAHRHADAPVWAVLGGFHMVRASTEEIRDVIDQLRELGVERVAPCHCSGDQTRRLMEEAFGGGYNGAGVGTRLVFD